MRLLVVHDANGNIAGFVLQPADSPGGLVTVPGQFVTEVEVPDVAVDPAKPESYRRVSELIDDFRVEKTRGRLVRKTASTAD